MGLFFHVEIPDESKPIKVEEFPQLNPYKYVEQPEVMEAVQLFRTQVTKRDAELKRKQRIDGRKRTNLYSGITLIILGVQTLIPKSSAFMGIEGSDVKKVLIGLAVASVIKSLIEQVKSIPALQRGNRVEEIKAEIDRILKDPEEFLEKNKDLT